MRRSCGTRSWRSRTTSSGRCSSAARRSCGAETTTACRSSRLRGKGRPCYNVVEVEGTHVDVWRRYPFHGQEKIIQFSTETKTYEKYTAKIEDEVRST